MRLLTKPISKKLLSLIAKRNFGELVKAVVDVSKEIMVIDADLHADQEAFLLKKGSEQIDLWGINLYPNVDDDNFIEFDSMINLRPNYKNLSRGVDDKKIRVKIREIVSRLVR